MPDTVVITRPAAQAGPLAAKIAALGWPVTLLPLLEIHALDGAEECARLQAVLARLHEHDLVVFVSPNAIDCVFAHLQAWPDGVPLAVVGEGSRLALAAHGVTQANASITSPRDTARSDSEHLLLALDFARQRGDSALEAGLVDAARRYYLADEAYPTRFEPGGDEFLSGALTEALLMSAVLEADHFPSWLERFLPDLGQAQRLLTPAEVSDRSDPKIAHLDGLNLSRAWCLRGIAQALPHGHRWRELLLASAQVHTDASLPQVSNGHYEGEHWLATFGLLALSGRRV